MELRTTFRVKIPIKEEELINGVLEKLCSKYPGTTPYDWLVKNNGSDIEMPTSLN
jgi:hypothetical protein